MLIKSSFLFAKTFGNIVLNLQANISDISNIIMFF